MLVYMHDIIRDVADRLGLPPRGVEATVQLLDDGATVPFISRYRKERTGALDEVAIRDIESTVKSVRELYARRDFVRNAIFEAGALTPAIEARLAEAVTMTDVEDIYAPFKPKKRTRGTMARDKGLEPLAKIIMAARSPECFEAAGRFVGKNGGVFGGIFFLDVREITRRAAFPTTETIDRCHFVSARTAAFRTSVHLKMFGAVLVDFYECAFC